MYSVVAADIVKAFQEAGDDFGDSTTSALTQLQIIIDSDKAVETDQSSGKVLKNEGREHIKALATQCCKVFTGIPILIIIAGHSKSRWKAKLPPNHQEIPTLEISSISRSLEWPWLKAWVKRLPRTIGVVESPLLFILQLAALAKFQTRSVTIRYISVGSFRRA